MSDQEFMKLVAQGIDALGARVLSRMKNVAIVIADQPSDEQRAEQGLGPHDIIFGLYEGVPQTDRGLDDMLLLPDKITIFKNPILATYSNPDDIAACVSNTVWHEVAHHFGMDEEAVAREEERRGKTI